MPDLNLTPFQLMIVERLNYGKENAVTGKLLAKWLGQKDDRKIREEICLIIGKKWPILASVSGKHPGYYFAEKKEEVEAYVANLHKRSMAILVREKELKKAAKNINNPHQLPMMMKGRA